MKIGISTTYNQKNNQQNFGWIKFQSQKGLEAFEKIKGPIFSLGRVLNSNTADEAMFKIPIRNVAREMNISEAELDLYVLEHKEWIIFDGLPSPKRRINSLKCLLGAFLPTEITDKFARESLCKYKKLIKLSNKEKNEILSLQEKLRLKLEDLNSIEEYLITIKHKVNDRPYGQ